MCIRDRGNNTYGQLNIQKNEDESDIIFKRVSVCYDFSAGLTVDNKLKSLGNIFMKT